MDKALSWAPGPGAVPPGLAVKGSSGHADAYRPDIDGLRCVAVLSVVIYHALTGRLPGGFLGVDIFFVISGYLITRIIVRESGASEFSVANFYARRIKRLFPALITMLVAVLIAGAFLMPASQFAKLGYMTAASGAFVANLVLWQQVSYFVGDALTRPLLHLWSLGVEEQFYFAWPLLVSALVRRRALLLPGLLLIFFATLLHSCHLSVTESSSAFYSPLSRCWQLALGGLVAVVDGQRWRWLGPNLLAAAGALLIGASLYFVNWQAMLPVPWAIPATVGAAALIFAGPHASVNRLLSFRPAVAVGLISYPLYLWHWPLFSLLSLENLDLPTPWAWRVGVVLATFVLAILTHRFVERRGRRLQPEVLLVGMALVVAAGAAIWTARGLPGRPADRSEAKRLVADATELHTNGVDRLYRLECDFLQPRTLVPRERIDPSCLAPGSAGTALLWGDSHAQALSYGLRQALPAGVSLAQVTTSGCRVAPTGIEAGTLASRASRTACRRSNAEAMKAVRRLQPDILFLAQADGHEGSRVIEVAAQARRAGARRVVLIGPAPQWQFSLPSLLAARLPERPNRLGYSINPHVFPTDEAAKRSTADELEYVSLLDRLCDADGCVARAGEGVATMDHGHLSPSGSLLAGRLIIAALGLPQGDPAPPRSAAAHSPPRKGR